MGESGSKKKHSLEITHILHVYHKLKNVNASCINYLSNVFHGFKLSVLLNYFSLRIVASE